MIQPQGTGTPPPDNTAEQREPRYGTYQHGLVVVAEPGENRHYGPTQPESEVAS